MKRSISLLPLFLAALCLQGELPTARAAITSTGNIDPANPATWTSSTDGCIGMTADGTLSVDNGSYLRSGHGYIGCDNGVTGQVTVDGAGSTWYSSSYSFIGRSGNGTLNITDGGTVRNSCGYLGRNTDSTGQATVDGAGSRWTNTSDLNVGYRGSGTLSITGGGVVTSDSGSIGRVSGSTGQATVDGAGSTWTNSTYCYVGRTGTGTLHITGGGAVMAATCDIYDSQSLVTIDAGNGSLLNIGGGTGTINNDGTVRIVAGAGATAGSTYAPISAGTWTGGGLYQALGGTWNETTHEFTASAVQQGTSGTAVEIDLAVMQRVMIDDVGTGSSVGANFLAATSSTPLSFEATAISGQTLSDLEDLLAADGSVLGAWQFTADAGYTSGDPAHLLFDIGAGCEDLLVWHYDGTDWDAYAAADLTYDGTHASFTVTGFSGYAVTGEALTTVPEPTTITLLLLALALLGRRRHRARAGSTEAFPAGRPAFRTSPPLPAASAAR